MKHLVIVAHPRSDSLTMRLAQAYVQELSTLGHQHTLHDLYRMDFDPILTSAEIAQLPHATPPDVVQAQQDILAVDVVTVIYPLWWLSMPAILKGYVDRVFARGFAYEAVKGQVRGLLGGRQCVLLTLSGAPLPVLAGSGQWNALTMLQDRHVFHAVGFELLEHLHFDHIEKGLATAVFNEYLERIRHFVREQFGRTAH